LDLLLKFLNRLKTQYRPNAMNNISDRTFDPAAHYRAYKDYDMSYSQLLWEEDFANIYFIVKNKAIYDIVNFKNVVGLKLSTGLTKDDNTWELIVDLPHRRNFVLYTPIIENGQISFKKMSHKSIASVQMDHRPPMNELIELHEFNARDDKATRWNKIRKIHEEVCIIIVDIKFNNSANHNISVFADVNQVSHDLKSILTRRAF
jgi:hypothetical protein